MLSTLEKIGCGTLLLAFAACAAETDPSSGGSSGSGSSGSVPTAGTGASSITGGTGGSLGTAGSVSSAGSVGVGGTNSSASGGAAGTSTSGGSSSAGTGGGTSGMCPIMPASGVCTAGTSDLAVAWSAQTVDDTTTQLRPILHVENVGTAPIDLSQVEVRYWYTTEADAEEAMYEEADCIDNQCAAGCFSLQVEDAGKTTANKVLVLKGTAGMLAPGSRVNYIRIGAHRKGWGNYDQTNDYSFVAGATADTFECSTKVTAYLNGALVFGTEPE